MPNKAIPGNKVGIIVSCLYFKLTYLVCFRPEVLKSFGARTLKEIQTLAHLRVGETCPGCLIQIVATQGEADAINDIGGKVIVVQQCYMLASLAISR